VKVLFIYPDLFDFIPDYPGNYYVGIGSLAALVKREGHTARLIHLLKPWKNREEFLNRIDAENPDLIAFSSTTLQFSVVEQMARWLHEAEVPVPTLCGGVHPTICPEQAIAADGMNMICRGEGEGAIVEVCEKLERGGDTSSIRNLWVKTGNRITQNDLRPLEDLDALPFPDRDIFPNYQNLWWERNGTAVIMASRGCPFSCNYCCNKILREVHPNHKKIVRFRSPELVIEEIIRIRERFPFVTSLNFDDDILVLRKDWSDEFFQRYQREVALPFCCNVRPGSLTPKLAGSLRLAGCREVRIGIESGNDRIRNQVLNRSISRRQIFDTIALLRENELYVRSFNMVGIPFETPRDVLDTVKMNAELGIPDPQCTIFYPFPGTELHETCRKNGFLTERVLVDYYLDTALSLPTLSHGQILMFHHYFDRFLRLYSFLFSLPGGISRGLVSCLDTVLAHPRAPLLARAVRNILHRVRGPRAGTRTHRPDEG